ncbi:hypothetical protein [Massilia sp. CF038]|uniref:hypothetical protein n=1 Tax=Massilia sp. CF038 TaxID=1881045 RepID=UPI00091558C4|nr:hypothetical protein [Massilia sp. CF038]SHH21918.1 hypothetical protein SAMN05428948_3371 [Massilia sp. CF038]
MTSGFRRAKPLQVDFAGPKIMAWIGIVFFMLFATASILAGQVGPALLFCAFILFGAYILIAGGRLELDEEGISDINRFGHYRILWREVRSIEFSRNGMMLLHGDGKRFVMYRPGSWSGPKRRAAVKLFESKINNVPVLKNSFSVKLLMHKNVKTAASPPA